MAKKKAELTPEQAIVVETQKASTLWWDTEGRYIDPDFSDVDWYDKRGELARDAFEAGAKWQRGGKEHGK